MKTKIFYILFMATFASCGVFNSTEYELAKMHKVYGTDWPVQVRTIVADTINPHQKDIAICLEVENMTSDSIILCNLNNWYNAFPLLWQTDSLIDHSVRINSHMDKEYVILKKHETIIIKYDFPLDFIYGYSLERMNKDEVLRLEFVVRPLKQFPHLMMLSKPHTFVIQK